MIRLRIGISLLLLWFFIGFSGASAQQIVKLGALCDLARDHTTGVRVCEGVRGAIELQRRTRPISGYSIELVIKDHQNDIAVARAVFSNLRTAGVISFFTHGASIVWQFKDLVLADKVVMVAPTSTISEIEDVRKYPLIFRASPSYRTQMAAVLRHIGETWKEDRPARIAYGFIDGPVGRDPLGLLQRQTKALRMELVAYVACVPPCVDLKPMGEAIKAGKPDFIIEQVSSRSGLALKTFRTAGIVVPIIGLTPGLTEEEAKTIGKDGEGYIVVSYTTRPGDLETQKVIERIEKAYQKIPDDLKESYDFVRGVYAGLILAEGARYATVRAGGRPITSELFRQGLESIQGFTAEGLVSATSFTAENHEGSGLMRLYTVRNGKFVLVRDFFGSR